MSFRVKFRLNLTLTAWAGLLACLATGCSPESKYIPPDQATLDRLADEAKEADYVLINTEAFKSLIAERSNMVIVDCRAREDFEKEHLLGATNIPFPDGKGWDPARMEPAAMEQFARVLGPPKSQKVVFYGQNAECMRSHAGAKLARKLGYPDVRRYALGIDAWKASGGETRSLKE